MIKTKKNDRKPKKSLTYTKKMIKKINFLKKNHRAQEKNEKKLKKKNFHEKKIEKKKNFRPNKKKN